MVKRRMLAAGVALLVALVASCAKARINQFQGFSQAGTAYAKAVGALLDQAGATAIDTDTLLLVKDREAFSVQERGQQILARNKLMKERLAILGDLKRHAQLLQSYFEALGALAGSNAPSGIGGAAEGVVKSLGALHPSIQNATVGKLAVSSFVGSVVQIAVAHFQAAALEQELKKNAQALERELDLQEAALKAVADTLRTDLQVQLNQREAQEVDVPFASANPLPAGWPQKRKDTLQATLTVGSAAAAADAARKLKLSFIALAEGRAQLVDVPAMVSDINDILTLIEKVKGVTPPAKP